MRVVRVLVCAHAARVLRCVPGCIMHVETAPARESANPPALRRLASTGRAYLSDVHTCHMARLLYMSHSLCQRSTCMSHPAGLHEREPTQ